MRIYKYIGMLFATAFLVGCTESINNTNVFIDSKNPLHVEYAAGFIGLHERRDRSLLRTLVGVDPVSTEWCAAFLNAILKRQGILGSESVSDAPLMARSFLNWGIAVTTPERGDIMIFRRGNRGWQGHVAIYLGTVERNGRTYYRMLGGNQNDSVNIMHYPASKLIAIRRIDNSLQRVQGVKLTIR